VRKREGKQPIERFTSGRKDIIKINIEEMGWMGMDWISIAQSMDKLRDFVKAVTNIPVPQSAGNSLTSCKTVRVLRRGFFTIFFEHI